MLDVIEFIELKKYTIYLNLIFYDQFSSNIRKSNGNKIIFALVN